MKKLWEIQVINQLKFSVFISMSIGMDLKANYFVFTLIISIIGVNCQYDVINLINTTQNLQDIERNGVSGHRFQQIYPILNASDHHNYHGGNKSVGNTPLIYIKGANNSRMGIDRFKNKTLSTMPGGFCVIEVP